MLEELERLQDDPGWKKRRSFEESLEHLVSHELGTRQARAIERRIRSAGFPSEFRLEDYHFRRMPSLDEGFIRRLHACGSTMGTISC